ncbi:hypothetical protein [Micromonospora tarensis]|uniref:Uncharacterized protein n=1 Tax=Micromonospora tarensis TaxID=2806100 RepID=A0ABS1YKX4_9ACTN|nr:hypothetical protein [Micromonospora tarensis]MBM0278074.1 hypothetical protein [Micromonospora tarensis]
MTEDSRPVGARIADAVDVLRGSGVTVETSTQAGATIYAVKRPAYQVEIVVDSARFLGLSFHLLGCDGSIVVGYGVDTDLYNISLPQHRWFATDVETDIVLLLEALMQGKVLVDTGSPRASMVVPTGDGLMLVQRRRFLTTSTPYDGDASSALAAGFRSLPP